MTVMTTHFGQGRHVRYWCTDESRWGFKTLTGRVLTLRALRAFLRLEMHWFNTGISWYEARLNIVRQSVRDYLDHPRLTLKATA